MVLQHMLKTLSLTELMPQNLLPQTELLSQLLKKVINDERL